MRLLSLCISTLVFLAPVNADAATLFDSSPSQTGLSNSFDAYNVSDAQNFLTLMAFDRGVNLSGIANFSSYYSDDDLLGKSVQIRVFDDNAGEVGTLLFDISSSIISVENTGLVTNTAHGHFIERNFAAIDQFLPSGSYWIGMMGTSFDIGQHLVDSNSSFRTASMQGTTFTRFLDRSDVQGFDAAQIQVYGSPIPLPAGLPLLLAGVGSLGIVVRWKKKRA